MKRIVSLVLSLLMVCGCFAALATADAAELAPVELVYWIGGDGEQKDSAEVYAAINEKLTAQMNTTVKWVNVPFGEYYTKWSNALAAQEQMDLCWTGWVHNIEKEVANGALLALDDYAEFAPDLFASLKAEAVDMHRSSDGKLYQFPAWQGLVGNRHYFAFPKDKFDLLPDAAAWKTTLQDLLYANWEKSAEDKKVVYDQIETYLKTLKDNNSMAYGYAASANDLYAWYMRKGSYELGIDTYLYVDYYDDTFELKSIIDCPRYKINAEYMAKWFQAGYIRQDIASIEPTGLIIDWRTGTDSNGTYVMNGHNGFTDAAMEKELAGTIFPTEYVFTNPYTVFGNGAATGTSMPFTAKNPERAMMFMNLLVTEEGMDVYNLFSFGIEGKHYTWDANREAITTLGGEGQSASTWDYGARPWTLGSLMFAYNTKAYPHQYYVELKAAEENAYVEPLAKFKPDFSNIDVEQANIKAVFNEYDPMLKRGYLGADWEAKYDEFIAKVKAAGWDTYYAEIQSQVNAFVEANGSKW